MLLRYLFIQMKTENPSNILLNNNKSKLWQDSIYVGISLPFTLTEPMTPVRDLSRIEARLYVHFRVSDLDILVEFTRINSLLLNLFCRVDTIWCYYGG